MKFSARDLADALNAELLGPDLVFDGVAIDSRSVQPGQLFVPVIAERDGHDFIPAALSAGATGYLTSAPDLGSDGGPNGGPTGAAVSVLRVPDTTQALRSLGQLARSRAAAEVIAITGSVGKTSAKDLTRAAAESSMRTHASPRSFNNELGVPLTLASAPEDAELLIVEMGARGLGHIASLAEIAQPTVGMVTTVALAHSELFGSLESVAQAKGELVEALPPTGTAVLNADDPNVAAMAAKTQAQVVTFGLTRGDFRATNITLDDLLRPRFRLQTPDGGFDVELPVMGAHMALNAAGAVAAAVAGGVPTTGAVLGLSRATLSPWRMEVVRAANGLVVINDAYNANPTSMRAALDSLCSIEVPDRVAVVGTMAELGEEGEAEHKAIAQEATDRGIRLIAVNAPEYGSAAVHVTGRAEAQAVLGEIGEGVAILVKGSRVVGLEALAAELLEVNS